MPNANTVPISNSEKIPEQRNKKKNNKTPDSKREESMGTCKYNYKKC